MATVPNPRTWTVGELLTASKMNTDVRDALNFLLVNKPLAVLYTTNTITPNNSFVNVTWNQEILDRDGGHSTSSNTDRYTAQTAGWYRVHCWVSFNDSFDANVRGLSLSHSADSIIGTNYKTSPSNGYNTGLNVEAVTFMSVNQYVTVNAFSRNSQSLGTGATANRFEIEWVQKA